MTVSTSRNSEMNIWRLDLARGLPTKLTDRGANRYPLWTSNDQIVFDRSYDGRRSFVLLTASGAQLEQLLDARLPGSFAASDVSDDGKYLLFRAPS